MLLAGDLNAAPNSVVIDELDKQFERTCTDHCGFTIPQDLPKKTIDFIAFRKKKPFNVLKHEVIPETFASDHRPVLALLYLPAK